MKWLGSELKESQADFNAIPVAVQSWWQQFNLKSSFCVYNSQCYLQLKFNVQKTTRIIRCIVLLMYMSTSAESAATKLTKIL